MGYSNLKTILKNNESELVLADFSGKKNSCQAIIKTVLPALTTNVVDRLTCAMNMQHMNIFEVVDFGECCNEQQNKQYVTFRYTPGVTLTQILVRLDELEKKAPIPFVVHVLCDVCNALHYLHSRYIDERNRISAFHGALCPDNIYITLDGDVCLTDAVIADMVTYRFNGTDLIENKPTRFQHPEVVDGVPIKRYHELYSTGLLLLCMLVGKKQFDRFFNGNGNEKLKLVGQYFPSIPDELDRIIRRATSSKGIGKILGYDKVSDLAKDLINYSFKESVVYDREMTSLFVYALFNHLENEPENFHEEQMNKARAYIQNGNDNALKLLLEVLLNIESGHIENMENSYNPDEGIDLPVDSGDDLHNIEATIESLISNDSEPVETAYLDELTDNGNNSDIIFDGDDILINDTESALEETTISEAVKKYELKNESKEHSISCDITHENPLSEISPPKNGLPESNIPEKEPRGNTIRDSLESELSHTDSWNITLSDDDLEAANNVINEEDENVYVNDQVQYTKDTLQNAHMINTVNQQHPFHKICKKSIVVDAIVFPGSNVANNEGIEKEYFKQNRLSKDTININAFCNILKKSVTSHLKTHSEIFVNILKKEYNYNVE